MDPFLQAMLQSMQGTEALQPSFGGPAMGADPASTGGDIMGMSSDEFTQMLSGLKAPQSTKPVFGGGVSGTGLPFLQAMPNILSPALNNSAQRIASTPQLPSLGQLMAGGR